MKEDDLISMGFTREEDPMFYDETGRTLIYFSKDDFLSNSKEEAEANNGNYTVQLLGSEYDYEFNDSKDLRELFEILERTPKRKSEFNFESLEE